MKNPKPETPNSKPETRNSVPKMNAAARVAAYRTSRSSSDYKGYRPNPRRTPSGGNAWRQRPL